MTIDTFRTELQTLWNKSGYVSAAILAVLLLTAQPAAAQSPIIIGPSSQFQWDMPSAGMTATLAQACTYTVSVNGGPQTPLVGPVTCSAPVAPATAPSCSVLLSAQTVIPLPSAGLTLTTTCNGVTSLPSTVFSYVVVVIPVPTNLRFK